MWSQEALTCSKSKKETPEQCVKLCSCVSIVEFEEVSAVLFVIHSSHNNLQIIRKIALKKETENLHISGDTRGCEIYQVGSETWDVSIVCPQTIKVF